jgi:hypothetical protein
VKRNDLLLRQDQIRIWIAEKRSKSFICSQLRCHPSTLKTYLGLLGIKYAGNKGSQGFPSKRRKPATTYLYNGSDVGTHRLKKLLLRDGLKEARCEYCQQTDWCGKAIPLELHHVNGNRYDNRIDNLHVVCPNCHALTDNHAGKSLKIPKILSGKSGNGKRIPHLAARKVERPSKGELQQLVWQQPTSHLAKQFGVSDKAIEKWCKSYSIDKPPRGYWAKRQKLNRV